MKKIIAGLIILTLLGTAGFYGYKYLLGFTSDQFINHIITDVLEEDLLEELIKDANVEELIQEFFSQEIDLSNPNRLEELPISNKEDGVKVVLSRVSIGEIRDISARAETATPEEQQQIVSELKERFTEEEIEALLIIGITEIKNQLASSQ